MFKNNPIVFDYELSSKWIENHRIPAEVQKQMHMLLNSELGIKAFSDVKIHVKIEALLKSDPIDQWSQGSSRMVAWQRYAVAAIFAPVFLEAKRRLKVALNKKTIYADGLKPSELSDLVRQFPEGDLFFENDLEKQDRQTDDAIIEVEMRLYELLGVSASVLNIYRSVHGVWRWRSSLSRGIRKATRQSGQVTTALGNVTTNMQSHAKVICDNAEYVNFTLILGDDMAVNANKGFDPGNIELDTQTNFNMVCKPHINAKFGTFCQLLIYPTDGNKNEVGPDFVRLRLKFEVTGGSSLIDPNNIEMRSMSYAMMLGDTPEVVEMVRLKGWPIVPTKWYNMNYAMRAMQYKHDLNYEQVMHHYFSLIKMMEEQNSYLHEFYVFTSKPKWE